MNKVKKETPIKVIKEKPKRMKKIKVQSNNVIIRYDYTLYIIRYDLNNILIEYI